MKKSLGNIFSKLSYFSCLLMLFLTSTETKVYATSIDKSSSSSSVSNEIDTWGKSLLGIIVKLLRYGGIISLCGIAIFLYVNNDEQGAKRGKTAFLIVIVATFIAWFGPGIYDMFTK